MIRDLIVDDPRVGLLLANGLAVAVIVAAARDDAILGRGAQAGERTAVHRHLGIRGAMLLETPERFLPIHSSIPIGAETEIGINVLEQLVADGAEAFGTNLALIVGVAQAGSVSSFMDPERSTTSAMSRGPAMAIAEASESKVVRPKMRPKNRFAVRARTVDADRVGHRGRRLEGSRPHVPSSKLDLGVRGRDRLTGGVVKTGVLPGDVSYLVLVGVQCGCRRHDRSIGGHLQLRSDQLHVSQIDGERHHSDHHDHQSRRQYERRSTTAAVAGEHERGIVIHGKGLPIAATE